MLRNVGYNMHKLSKLRMVLCLIADNNSLDWKSCLGPDIFQCKATNITYQRPR